jgi:hypothetical protein
MEAFVSFVAGEEDLSFLVMTRVKVIILHVSIYVATLDIQRLSRHESRIYDRCRTRHHGSLKIILGDGKRTDIWHLVLLEKKSLV